MCDSANAASPCDSSLIQSQLSLEMGGGKKSGRGRGRQQQSLALHRLESQRKQLLIWCRVNLHGLPPLLFRHLLAQGSNLGILTCLYSYAALGC